MYNNNKNYNNNHRNQVQDDYRSRSRLNYKQHHQQNNNYNNAYQNRNNFQNFNNQNHNNYNNQNKRYSNNYNNVNERNNFQNQSNYNNHQNYQNQQNNRSYNNNNFKNNNSNNNQIQQYSRNNYHQNHQNQRQQKQNNLKYNNQQQKQQFVNKHIENSEEKEQQNQNNYDSPKKQQNQLNNSHSRSRSRSRNQKQNNYNTPEKSNSSIKNQVGQIIQKEIQQQVQNSNQKKHRPKHSDDQIQKKQKLTNLEIQQLQEQQDLNQKSVKVFNKEQKKSIKLSDLQISLNDQESNESQLQQNYSKNLLERSKKRVISFSKEHGLQLQIQSSNPIKDQQQDSTLKCLMPQKRKIELNQINNNKFLSYNKQQQQLQEEKYQQQQQEEEEEEERQQQYQEQLEKELAEQQQLEQLEKELKEQQLIQQKLKEEQEYQRQQQYEQQQKQQLQKEQQQKELQKQQKEKEQKLQKEKEQQKLQKQKEIQKQKEAELQNLQQMQEEAQIEELEIQRSTLRYKKPDQDRERKQQEIERLKIKYPQLSETQKCYSIWLREPTDKLQLIFEDNVIANTSENNIPQYNEKIGDPTKLNQTKDKIDSVVNEWDSIKYLLNDYELVDIYRHQNVQIERYALPVIDFGYEPGQQTPVFSRAYYKLWEIISEYKILDKHIGKPLTIASLAEGPGGFIQCMIDYRQLQHEQKQQKYKLWTEDSYYGITLKLEKSNDWDFPKAKKYFQNMKKKGYKINLSYGAGNGNLYYRENIEHFAEKDLQNKKCQFITSDGGIEVNGRNYNYQELANAKLFFAECIQAMIIQEKQGTFILKIYDSVYDITLQIIQLLCLFYKSVRLIKPLLSRPASSERYVLCENFVGIDQDQIEILLGILEVWKDTETNISDYLANAKKVNQILSFLEDKNYEKWLNEKFYPNMKDSNTDCFQKQIKKIEKGFELLNFKKENQWEFDHFKEKRIAEQEKLCKQWCRKHQIPYLRY